MLQVTGAVLEFSETPYDAYTNRRTGAQVAAGVSRSAMIYAKGAMPTEVRYGAALSDAIQKAAKDGSQITLAVEANVFRGDVQLRATEVVS